MNNIITTGIDYSITSPAICTHNGPMDDFTIDNCKFLFLTTTKKRNNFWYEDGNFTIKGLPHYHSDIDVERFSAISEGMLAFIMKYKGYNIAIEDYSFGSKGKIFNLAENMGILKFKLNDIGLKWNLYSPGTIKKFATGKGDSLKEIVVDAFLKETKIPLMDIFKTKNKKSNPLTDIVDSYFICKYHNNLLLEGLSGNRNRKV